MSEVSAKKSNPVLVMVVAIPLLTVIAGLVTVVIASRSGFTAQPEVKLDRFARETEKAAGSERP